MNSFTLSAKYYQKNLTKKVDASDIQNSDKEMFIDFRGEHRDKGKLIVQAKDFSKTKAEIASRLKEESVNRPSIIKIFIDTTSRFRFYRKFKKTIKFLTELKHNPESRHMVLENLKHHNVGGNTDPNQLAFVYGVSYEQCFDGTKHRLKRADSYAKKLGYITGYT